MTKQDTIYALATARGQAAIAIIRISGTAVDAVLQGLAACLPEPRRATRRTIRNRAGDGLDDGLVLRFLPGKSYTGEAMAELHLHGGRATIQAVLAELESSYGLREAQPGEFTLRALRNGQMDLAQVEGLGDLIAAETEAQRQMAMRVYSGAVGHRALSLNTTLTECLALIETEIEFSEEDLPPNVRQEILEALELLCADLGAEVRGVVCAERLRSGFEVAIVGSPNIGKSTLANTIAGREAAITSTVAGTTRDVLEIHLDLGGMPVCLLDMAGLRETADPVESIGVERARQRAEAADVRLFLTESRAVPDLGLEPREHDIVAIGKADQGDPGSGFAVSGTTGQGVDEVLAQIVQILEARVASIVTMTNTRHRGAIEEALGHLGDACACLAEDRGHDEMAAEHIRSAMVALEGLTGKIGVEQVLGQIFSRFCIGK